MFGRGKLLERIKKLEEELKRVEQDMVRCRNIVLRKPDPYGIYSFWPDHIRHQISHGDAIQKILDHMGLKFEYVEGTPANVVLSKVPKK